MSACSTRSVIASFVCPWIELVSWALLQCLGTLAGSAEPFSPYRPLCLLPGSFQVLSVICLYTHQKHCSQNNSMQIFWQRFSASVTLNATWVCVTLTKVSCYEATWEFLVKKLQGSSLVYPDKFSCIGDWIKPCHVYRNRLYLVW